MTERDREIAWEILRWRCCLGRHIRFLAGFTGQRATDRRLYSLIHEQFIERKHILYGVASLYSVTRKGINFFDFELSQGKPKVDQIRHDIAVVDTAIYFIKAYNVLKQDIISERQLRHEKGFNPRTHFPDFIFTKDGKKACVEVELSIKTKIRLDKILKENFLKFDIQYWVISKNKNKIVENVTQAMNKYPNIEIIQLEVVQEYVGKSKEK